MNTFDFTVTLDRVPADDDYDRLFEAGLDDATPETRDGRGVLNVHREADSLTAAILSSVADIEQAGFVAVAIEDEDLVSLKTVAQRLGRSYESVRLLATGKRGPGNFPAPLSGDGWALYSWAQVSDWMSAQRAVNAAPAGDVSATSLEYSRVIAAASQLMRARAIATPETIASLIPLVIPSVIDKARANLSGWTEMAALAARGPEPAAANVRDPDVTVRKRDGARGGETVRVASSRAGGQTVKRKDGGRGETVSKTSQDGKLHMVRKPT